LEEKPGVAQAAACERLAAGACMLDLVLVSELLQPANTWAYPYNSLRNQVGAESCRRTPFDSSLA
jgi:hypothetical protein